MTIYGIGAHFDKEDLSGKFKNEGIIGIIWKETEALELHQMIQSLKVGDIVYIKSFSPSSPDIIIKGISIILDNEITSDKIVKIKRSVKWIDDSEFRITKDKVKEKNNVRNNAMYEEFHPVIQKEILKRIPINISTPVKN
ncbi:MAG: hypothetical protein A2504_09980 [Bdellovibrionales bacterium RIFOXYD12_FULL_39_22]|nr:MAG: hypothetical protein A2385_17615 [Bdellovibrionales bacterium RIFOXYB1_FULL_39_21]OFZ43939.1 MAG: hypothetical protein A2485_04285 [Bdellovibrionales bacterium RIFOXYC12_FULL_39_17]OFZ48311.1 MAG: hypothetical protein A2404_01700 [Bdellovibrionales bacterium RIFOXYC1_FULL_39_130]OFZ94902.1 MAG: hypothetical protein A2504_09980 [Bdellovibrionales bacterium RIFOXYD12_FULL_39_22]HLE12677.1 hypothetical protein [Bacteriovoracaceae bacterium]